MPLAALALAAATTASPTPLMWRGPWEVRYEENLCLLAKAYGPEQESTTLLFQPLLDTGSMDLFVIAKTKGRDQKVGKATVSVLPDVSYRGGYFSVWSGPVKARITRVTLDRSVLDQLKEGDTLRIQADPIDLAFTVPGPAKARAALQGCIDNLKRSWGIDPANTARADGPVEGNPARYFGSDSYPREALAKGVFGRVVALLTIDEQGAVTHCRILSSAGKELNEGTCVAAQRIRFKPPHDKDGKPLPSIYTLPVRWVLPGQEG